MRRALGAWLTMAAAAAALAALAACAAENGPHDRSSVVHLRNADAYNEAVRRCPAGRVRQAEGTDGFSPSDYICTGH